ncbi:hypothetical protein [Vreelandella venusta]|uniref:Uncharacterized protein n=1 Tax=Vreelandella venusta TaxID=44935 RepID=A0AAP9ZAY7_9GAMM|nr:hypothetical protein [Halomonas venusta]QRL02098.1 hypothetical protein JDS37_12320 [Halomonas venusta]GEK53133.1 hypothetical protein HVE01_38540 [Halomonas venusta]
MSQAADLLVHIGPLREESETLIKQANLAVLLASLSPVSAHHKALSQVLPALHIADQPITPPGGEAVCYAYTLKDFNSLAPASELTTLYPGLGKARHQSVDTQTLPQALEQAGQSQATFSHLIIEQPEISLSLLQAFNHSGLLDQLTHLWVRTSPLRLYEGMATDAELTQWCEQQGFEVVAQHATDPDFFLLSFTRSPLYHKLKETHAQLAEYDTQLSQLTEERDTLKKQLNQAIKANQQQKKEHQETEQALKKVEQHYQDAVQAEQKAQEKLQETHSWFTNRKQQAEEGVEKIASLQEKLTHSEEEREKYQRYFANRKKQHEEAEAELVKAQQQLTEKDATISQLSEQLASLQQSNERFGQLESKLESLFGEQRSYIQQTTNALGQHVTRSARQQRDEQALMNYLQHGQRPISTTLAPGYAMALLEHYNANNHDVIVIFGSNGTTELLAQSVINARAEQPKLTRQKGQHHGQEHEVTLSHADLPQTIISITHQKVASDELKQCLNNKRLSHAVNVVHAPWIECQANGQTALFYAANTVLQRLNQWLPEDARVLAIIGETLVEAGHSREAALTLLLQQLPTQRLDIVLEGNSYPQENDLKEGWNTLLETRQRPAQWLTLPNTISLRVEG